MSIDQGRYDFGLVRTEVDSGNPWRINYLKATRVWERGDLAEVLAKPSEEVGKSTSASQD